MPIRPIKDCPFCGARPNRGPHDAFSFHVQCSNPECRATIVVGMPDHFPYGYDDATIGDWCIDEATILWNKRSKKHGKKAQGI